MTSSVEERIAARVEALPEGLRRHIYRVQELALELAHFHDVDEQKARLGSLAHDIARAMKAEQLRSLAHELEIPIHPVEDKLPLLLHGPVAAEMLRQLDGIDDPDIYDAVYWHSTAHKGLSSTGKVVFLADKLDPDKAGRYPYLPELKVIAVESLDKAIIEFLSRELVTLLQSGSIVHPASVEARNELLETIT